VQLAPADDGSLDFCIEAALGFLFGNPVLERMQRLVHQLWVASWTELGLALGNRPKNHAEHIAILDVFSKRDADLAVAVMRHVDRTVLRARKVNSAQPLAAGCGP